MFIAESFYLAKFLGGKVAGFATTRCNQRLNSKNFRFYSTELDSFHSCYQLPETGSLATVATAAAVTSH